jgi:hypothetical protein
VKAQVRSALGSLLIVVVGLACLPDGGPVSPRVTPTPLEAALADSNDAQSRALTELARVVALALSDPRIRQER